jgi:hypothetical protein
VQNETARHSLYYVLLYFASQQRAPIHPFAQPPDSSVPKKLGASFLYEKKVVAYQPSVALREHQRYRC